VPRSVLREVYARDGGQCTFVSADGRRCAARGLLEIHHHDTPYALGGAATVDNLRLMCRVHNGLQAERRLQPSVHDSQTPASARGARLAQCMSPIAAKSRSTRARAARRVRAGRGLSFSVELGPDLTEHDLSGPSRTHRGGARSAFGSIRHNAMRRAERAAAFEVSVGSAPSRARRVQAQRALTRAEGGPRHCATRRPLTSAGSGHAPRPLLARPRRQPRRLAIDVPAARV